MPADRSYIEVRVRVAPRAADAAEEALLELGALGTSRVLEGEDGAAAWTEVCGYFRPSGSPTRERIAAALDRLTLAPDSTDARIEIGERPWRDWVAETRAALGSRLVTERLRIRPSWEPAARTKPAEDAGADELIIEPAQAFGTGTHATTRGCLELLEALPARERTGAALDIGTGTGILALRAAQLGWGPVCACDNDPLAAEAARDNARRNAAGARLLIFAGESASIRGGRRFTLLLANLFLNPLRDHAPFFARSLEREGTLIVSGIQAADRTELLALLARQGWLARDERQHGEWVACALRRAP